MFFDKLFVNACFIFFNYEAPLRSISNFDQLLKLSERVFNKKMVILSQGLPIKEIEKHLKQIFDPFFLRKQSYHFFQTSPALIP